MPNKPTHTENISINNNKPVHPKDASSLIILRNSRKSIEVLMGRRPLSSRFMPGIYVFPGGALDKTDYYVYKNVSLNKSINIRKLKARNTNHMNALAKTAIRETYEETGLMLAEKGKMNIDKNKIINTGWLEFFDKGLYPAVNKLLYLGRAVTPSVYKVRFHARFFVAVENDFIGTLKTSKELEKLIWIKLEEVKNIKCADVTEFMINELINIGRNISLLHKIPKKPMFTWRYGKRYVSRT